MGVCVVGGKIFLEFVENEANISEYKAAETCFDRSLITLQLQVTQLPWFKITIYGDVWCYNKRASSACLSGLFIVGFFLRTYAASFNYNCCWFSIESKIEKLPRLFEHKLNYDSPPTVANEERYERSCPWSDRCSRMHIERGRHVSLM